MTVTVEATALTGAEPTLAQAIAAVRAYAQLVEGLSGPTTDASAAAIEAAADAAAALAQVLSSLATVQSAKADALAAAAGATTERQAAQAAAAGIDANVTLARKWATQTGAEVVAGQGYGAKKYALDAAGSATTAAGSVTAAGTKATAAAGFATTAAARAADAANALAAFLDRYYGPLSTAPTTRPSGAARVVGDLYDDISDPANPRLRIWTGTLWDVAAYSPGGVLVAANNLSDLTDKAQARINLGIEKFVSRGNATYTILPEDRTVGLTTALTAARTWTLPAANSVSAGAVLRIIDLVGGISLTNTLTIARAGTDTINGGTSFLIAGAYADVVFVSDGASRWVFGIVGLARGGTGATTASGARANLFPPYSGNALNRLRLNAAGTDIEFFAPLADLQEFLVSGTWTKPAGAVWVFVEAVAGGGSGPNVLNLSSGIQGGGGGGGYDFALFRAADLPATVSVGIGAGGAAIPSGTAGNGSAGGDTTFGSFLSVSGGLGGQGSLGGQGGTGEPGGNSTSAAGTSGYASAGGSYGNGPAGRSTQGGGGGGGASNTAGLTTPGGVSRRAGNGGTGNSIAGQKAGDGAVPGGGGGASTNDGGSGAGGSGRLRARAW